MKTLTFTSVAEDRELVRLTEARERMDARLTRLDDMVKTERIDQGGPSSMSEGEFREVCPGAAREHDERVKEAQRTWSSTPAIPSRFGALMREASLVRYALGDTDRAIWQRQNAARNDRLLALHRTDDFRELVLAVAVEAAGRYKAALDYLAATTPPRREGIRLEGLPASIWREIEELSHWLSAFRRCRVFDVGDLRRAGLHEHLVSMVEVVH